MLTTLRDLLSYLKRRVFVLNVTRHKKLWRDRLPLLIANVNLQNHHEKSDENVCHAISLVNGSAEKSTENRPSAYRHRLSIAIWKMDESICSYFAGQNPVAGAGLGTMFFEETPKTLAQDFFGKQVKPLRTCECFVVWCYAVEGWTREK